MPTPDPHPQDRAPRRSRNLSLSDATVRDLDELAARWGIYSDTGKSSGSPNRSATVEHLVAEAIERERAGGRK